MICKKCRAAIPDNSKFCSQCGAKMVASQATKSRGNGQGSVYKRGKTWTAAVTMGYTMVEGKLKRTTKTKSGFKTKREAIAYLPTLAAPKQHKPEITLKELYETWLPTHRAGPSTMNCYKAAWKYFGDIKWMLTQDITVDDLQDCLDDCPHGRRTRENMKALAGLLYKYAIPRHYADLNMGEYLIVSGAHGTKEGLPIEALDKIRENVGKVPGADFVACQCYLGFRPAEFLALDMNAYNAKERAFVGGAKTDAGTNRTVTVSPKIQPIVDRLTKDRISGAIFGKENGLPMSAWEYRDLFYSVLEKCGIDNPVTEVAGKKVHKYTPHSCRHTFATLMKRVEAADKDKLELIGHTSTEMLRYYQDVSLDDLRKITDSI